MSYILANPGVILALTWGHLQMTVTALLLAAVVALPLGWLVSRNRRLAAPVLGVLGVIYTIPSLALIILLVPFFGLDPLSVILALALYVQVILVRNLVAGLDAIDPALIEAARGMGMSTWERWTRVQLPLALPVILAGVRLSAVVAIGIAAIGAKFSAGGLGQLLFEGIAQNRDDKIWAGAISLGLLALAVNGLLQYAERRLDPLRRQA